MRAARLAATALVLTLIVRDTFAQAPAADKDFVTKQDYERLRAQMESMQQEIDTLKKDRAAQAAEVETLKKDHVRQADLDKAIDEIEKDAKKRSDLLADVRTGNNMLLTGYAFAAYNNRHHDTNTFDAGFNPIFIWKLSDRILFESEVELTFNSEGDTDVSLEFADISYIVNDYLTVGAGKFLLPFSIFNERLHPAWINKLPDRPLPFDDEVGIAPEFDIGAFARGGAPL